MTTTKEDQIRAEFEKNYAGADFTRNKHGSYAESYLQELWYAWRDCAESYEKKLAEKDAVIDQFDRREELWLETERKLDEANKRNAMLVDALTEMQKQLQAACKKLGGSALTAEFDMLNFYISANSEAVAAWEEESAAANKGREIV